MQSQGLVLAMQYNMNSATEYEDAGAASPVKKSTGSRNHANVSEADELVFIRLEVAIFVAKRFPAKDTF